MKWSVLVSITAYFLFEIQSEGLVSSDLRKPRSLEDSSTRTLIKSFDILLGNRNTLSQLLEDDASYKQRRYRSKISWLDYTDAKMQQYYQQSASEAANIAMGWVRANPHCNSASSLQSSTDCVFHNIVDKFLVANRNISASNLAGEQLANLEALTLLTINLFNAALYHQALALAIFLRTSIIPHFAADLDANSTNLAVQIEKSKLVCFVIQFETMREQNLFYELDSIALRLIYQALIVEKLDHNRHDSPIYRLRYALAIPSIPMMTALSTTLRTSIITSLQQLSSYFIEINTSPPTEVLKEFFSATPFHMAHQGLNDRDFQYELGNTFVALYPGLAYTADTVKSHVPVLRDHIEGSKDAVLKLGFISAHFFSHSIGRVMIDTLFELSQVITSLTRKNDKGSNYTKTSVTFEVYVYFIDKPDSTVRTDDVTKQYESLFGNRFIRIQAGNLSHLQYTVINDHLDFLMYTDLGMEIHSYLLSFSRLAPIQAMWWGHPVTSGLPSIDYFFGLDVEIPDAALEQYTEQLIRFKFVNTIPFNVTRDEWQEDSVDSSSIEVVNARSLLPGLGLHHDAMLVSVLGRLFKMHPDFISLLASLLLEIHRLDAEDRVYLVFFGEQTFDFNQLLIDALSEAVMGLSFNASITPAVMRRVKLLHFGLFYHQLLPITRIVLDTYPYGGCISSHDAFYHAIPIVSLPSDFIRGRFTLALYQQMNITSSIVPLPDSESFVKIATPFIFDDQFYRVQRNLLRERLTTAFIKNKEVAKEWSEFIIRLFL